PRNIPGDPTHCRTLLVIRPRSRKAVLGRWSGRDGAGLEQVGQIGRVGCIAKKWSDAEDFLHSTQVGGMRVIHRARIGKAVNVFVSMRRDDNLAYGVIKVVTIVAGDAIRFGL